MVDPEMIYNWRRLDDRITTSGQPTEQQLADIRALGVRHIVNLGLHTHEKAPPRPDIGVFQEKARHRSVLPEWGLEALGAVSHLFAARPALCSIDQSKGKAPAAPAIERLVDP